MLHRRALALLVLLLVAIPTFATSAITGNVKILTGSASSTGLTLYYELKNCTIDPTTVSGSVINSAKQAVFPDSFGNVSFTLFRNDTEVSCRGAFSSYYQFTILYNGKLVWLKTTLVNAASADLATMVPLAINPPTPVTNYVSISGTGTVGDCVRWVSTTALSTAGGPCAQVGVANTWTLTQTDSALHTFNAGITGTGNIGTLTLGTGALGAATTWTLLHTFNAGITGTGNIGALTLGTGALGAATSWGALHTFNAGIKVGANGTSYTQFELKNGVAGCTTAAAVGATCSTVVTWPTAFVDAAYMESCQGSGVSGGVPLHGGIIARTASAVTFQTVAGTAGAAQYATIECAGWHL